MSFWQECLKNRTLICEIKRFLGIGVGVNSPLAQIMARDLLTDLYRTDYNIDSAVGNKDYGAPQLFTLDITADHLTYGSKANQEALEKFKRLKERLEGQVLPSYLRHSISQYIKLVVGRKKAEDYTNKYFAFLAENTVVNGNEAQYTLARYFSGGQTPSKEDIQLAGRLANQVDQRGSLYTLSISASLKSKIGVSARAFNQQHLAAVKAAIVILEHPEDHKNITGYTFGRVTGLVDQQHREKPKTPELA